MLNVALRFQVSGLGCYCDRAFSVPYARRRLCLSPRYRLQSVALVHRSVNSESFEPSISSSDLNFTTGYSAGLHNYHWSLKDRQIHTLMFLSCAAAISATWLCFSLIPTVLAFKKAAKSTKKLMRVVREEIPGTVMAARLSGMEISETMKLSDLRLELTPSSRRSTQAVRLAKERSARSSPIAIEVAPNETGIPESIVAKTAQGAREGIIKGRAVVQMFFSLTRLSKMLLSYYSSRAKP